MAHVTSLATTAGQQPARLRPSLHFTCRLDLATRSYTHTHTHPARLTFSAAANLAAVDMSVVVTCIFQNRTLALIAAPSWWQRMWMTAGSMDCCSVSVGSITEPHVDLRWVCLYVYLLVPLIVPIFINRLIDPRKTNYSIYFDLPVKSINRQNRLIVSSINR